MEEVRRGLVAGARLALLVRVREVEGEQGLGHRVQRLRPDLGERVGPELPVRERAVGGDVGEQAVEVELGAGPVGRS